MIVVVGAGVVGLHVGIALAQLRKRLPIFICERERSLGVHTSTRNSEVLHAGFAYPVGSLKALLCVEGNPLTYEWLRRLGVAHAQCGKWIVAFDATELPALEKVLEVGAQCGVPLLERVTATDMRRSEPHCRRFAGVVRSGTSGIMDAAAYMKALEAYFTAQDDCYVLSPCTVTAVDPEKCVVSTTRGDMQYTALINAAGLWADEVYHMAGGARGFRIKPFKGEYYTWRRGPVRAMVYPVPRRYLSGGSRDGRQVSYMGIHVHRSVGGDVYVGPTHVELAWGQKADYGITTPKEVFVREASRIADVPEPEALAEAYAGNRPKLYEDGTPVGDFHVGREGAAVHLLGIESPGLTAAPAIARVAARLVVEMMS